jgi:hypothetical protein
MARYVPWRRFLSPARFPVSTGSNPQVDTQISQQKIDLVRRQINRLIEETAQLAEKNLEPAAFYSEFLQRVLSGIAGAAGAVWVRTALGHLQLQFQINMQQVNLEKTEAGRQKHDQLLRQACLQGQSLILPPQSGAAAPEDGGPTPGNPTDFFVLLAPLVVEGAVVGLVEVWEDPRHSPDALPGFLQFLVRMASLASVYVRNLQLRQLVGQQQVWEDLEKFARQIHGSLNPTEVAYLIANEGRRLVSCDRLSIAVREGRKAAIEAISGADVVEKRSSLVQLQRTLAEKVADWGERLVYQGTKDESLPAPVLQSLDAYLAESNSKFLVVQPLRDEREKDNGRPPRTTLVMESFEPALAPEQLLARLDVVGRHATSALYNAVEHRRIPLRYLWMPLARYQEGFSSKTRAIAATAGAAALILLLLLIIVPYPLKMEASGHILPEHRGWVFSPRKATVKSFPDYVVTGATVLKGQSLIEMFDKDLQDQLIKLRSEIQNAEAEIASLRQQSVAKQNTTEYPTIMADLRRNEVLRAQKKSELDALIKQTNPVQGKLGYFRITAPLSGMVLNAKFQENLLGKTVEPSEPLLRVGDRDRPWEAELRIPNRHIGQVRRAFEGMPSNHELDVDLLLASAPTRTYKGKLSLSKIAGEATPNKDDPNDNESVVVASVRVEGPGIDKADQIPADLLVADTRVSAKVRCGNRPMIYSLFYGVWEFVYEKVIFYF